MTSLTATHDESGSLNTAGSTRTAQLNCWTVNAKQQQTVNVCVILQQLKCSYATYKNHLAGNVGYAN
jgi:hypothetical protein